MSSGSKGIFFPLKLDTVVILVGGGGGGGGGAGTFLGIVGCWAVSWNLLIEA
jgi:hypothetical protein